MKTVTLNAARRGLSDLIKETLDNREEFHIATDEGSVVLLPQDEYSAMLETLHLLSDKKSLRALLESHALRDAGSKPSGLTPDEVFHDV